MNFSDTHPKLALEWHPTKNGDILPTNITAKERKKYWWKCNNGPDHEWENSPKERIDGKELDLYIPTLKIGIEYDGAYYHAKKLKQDNEKNNFFSER
ncbi:zinc-ribbon domain-containing protein, partial [Amylibacter sp.]|nr:zinc-ribbon domain-containing protein [Amylibacter sp.]